MIPYLLRLLLNLRTVSNTTYRSSWRQLEFSLIQENLCATWTVLNLAVLFKVTSPQKSQGKQNGFNTGNYSTALLWKQQYILHLTGWRLNEHISDFLFPEERPWLEAPLGHAELCSADAGFFLSKIHDFRAVGFYCRISQSGRKRYQMDNTRLRLYT